MKGLKNFAMAYGVFLGMLVLTNVLTRPVVRRVTAAANVPQLGAII